MDQQNVVHPYNGILLSHKKESRTDTCCYNMDEPGRQDAKRKEPVTKRPYLVCFHLYEMSQTGESIETESSRVVLTSGCGGESGGNGARLLMGFLFGTKWIFWD